MKIKRKVLNICLTALVVVVAIDLIAKNRYSHSMQFVVLTAAILGYLFWAFVYHKLDKSLTLTNYLEYVLTATLAIILLLGVFNL